MQPITGVEIDPQQQWPRVGCSRFSIPAFMGPSLRGRIPPPGIAPGPRRGGDLPPGSSRSLPRPTPTPSIVASPAASSKWAGQPCASAAPRTTAAQPARTLPAMLARPKAHSPALPERHRFEREGRERGVAAEEADQDQEAEVRVRRPSGQECGQEADGKCPRDVDQKVAQGNCELAQRLIHTPSQYRALTPPTPPTDNTRTLPQVST